MSHPRVRFTVRRLMLAVAVVAALLTAFEAGRQWEWAQRPALSGPVYLGTIKLPGGQP